MADEKPLPSGDNTPTRSWQQLVQTAGQLLVAFAAAMVPMLADKGSEITARTVILALFTAIGAAAATYGWSFVQLPETKKKQ